MVTTAQGWMQRRYLTRFRAAWHRVALWRLISAARIRGYHRIPEAPFRMWLEPRFRSVGSLAVYSLGLRYEQALRLLPRMLVEGDGFIDCGANQGVYGLYAASIVKASGRVVSIEPQPYAAQSIRNSARYNRFDHLTVLEAAISDKVGEAEFGIGNEPVSASLGKKSDNSIRVKTVTLDSVMTELNLLKVSYIKLDVEGSELLALQGGAGCVARFQPVIQFEAYDMSDPNVQGVWTHLAAAGYKFFAPESDALRPLGADRPQSFDVIALPAARLDQFASLIKAS